MVNKMMVVDLGIEVMAKEWEWIQPMTMTNFNFMVNH
jgi:hypothetical protein